MKTRFQVARVMAIVWVFAVFLPSFLSRGFGDIATVAVGVTGSLGIVVGLIKQSKKIALSLALIGAGGAILGPIFFFIRDEGNSPGMILKLAGSEATSLALGFCGLDLWSEWSRPNKPSLPIRLSVTPRACARVAPARLMAGW
jgi:hypothetical protein